ncbi:hypothetical protein BpHYR1_000757 [Brachionus plicatilis]|uniref:Uncharacterized protein n=1 Tax=Brachionus plicatilis TaxID=10195 RepID=A0A3M7S2W5_BRAPC|nr:hypothetical protein BpHYR1_000757 [Brachionus plicatilis]
MHPLISVWPCFVYCKFAFQDQNLNKSLCQLIISFTTANSDFVSLPKTNSNLKTKNIYKAMFC